MPWINKLRCVPSIFISTSRLVNYVLLMIMSTNKPQTWSFWVQRNRVSIKRHWIDDNTNSIETLTVKLMITSKCYKQATSYYTPKCITLISIPLVISTFAWISFRWVVLLSVPNTGPKPLPCSDLRKCDGRPLLKLDVVRDYWFKYQTNPFLFLNSTFQHLTWNFPVNIGCNFSLV